MNIIEKNVQSEIRNVVPSILIDFIWEIARENCLIGMISLVPVKLAFGSVQDIICETASGVTVRRVFGFTPVSTRLEVLRSGSQLEMTLAA